MVATFSKLCVKVEDIMGSEESLELSSFVPANEGEGEGGGVAEPVDTFCSLPLLLEKKDKILKLAIVKRLKNSSKKLVNKFVKKNRQKNCQKYRIVLFLKKKKS